MSECRKVQELTKEFLKKLLKVKKFKEMVISNKLNNRNYEPKRIRTKNINSNSYNDSNQVLPFCPTPEGIKTNHRNRPLKKIPPLINPLLIQNDNNNKEKESIATMKISQRKLPKIEKPKTSDKFKEKEKMSIKFKKIEEKKNDTKINNSNIAMKYNRNINPKKNQLKK